jgi:DNA-binding transcriptional LysR family regulator
MWPGHPLAGRGTVRLADCVGYPVGLPTLPHGVRQLIDLALAQTRESPFVAVESDSFDFLRNYDHEPDIVTFQIPIGLPEEQTGGLVHRPVDRRDLRPAEIFVGQLRDRTLPSSAASFLEQVSEAIRLAPA